MNSFKSHIIVDFLMIGVLGLFLALIHFEVFLQMGHRGFFIEDLSISLPRVLPETVPMGEATIWVIGGPVLCILAFAFFVDRIHKNLNWSANTSELFPVHPTELGSLYPSQLHLHNSSDPIYYISNPPPSTSLVPEFSSLQIAQQQLPSPSSRVSWGTVFIPNQSIFVRKCRYVAYQLFVFAFCLILTLLISEALKNVAARLRPDFISCCRPVSGTTGWVSPDEISNVCLGSKAEVLEAQKSFPSGHSSSSMISSFFIVIYLYKRFWNRGKRNFGIALVPVLMTFSLLVSLCIAASRNTDGRHHFSDIICGLIIGASCALVSLAFDPFTPSWEYDGTVSLKGYLYDDDKTNQNENDITSPSQPLTSIA